MYIYIYIYTHIGAAKYQIAHQKSTPQKSLWIFTGVVQWTLSGFVPMELAFCDFGWVNLWPRRPQMRAHASLALALYRRVKAFNKTDIVI